MLAPVVLFVYNRPWHTEQTLIALSENDLANKSVLYIYADGAKENATDEQLEKIRQVRNLIKSKQWCKEVHIIESGDNKGLANSIIDGVTKIVNQYGKIIVLEDDIVTSRGFLKYMNDALNLYENEEKVMHISAFVPRNKGLYFLPQTYFLKFMSCWGWATWQDAWKYICLNTEYLYSEITKDKSVLYDYNLDGAIRFEEQLETNLSGKIHTWAIKWFTSIYLRGGLCLYPQKSLVRNIGFDGSGVHCGNSRSDVYDVVLSNKVCVKRIELKESQRARSYLKKFYFSMNEKRESVSFVKRIKRRIKKLLKI